jgi:nucleoside-diphosphate-sugar epimerase
MSTTRLIFGCGYLGERVAARWHAAGDDVTVVSRSATRANELQQRGYRTIVADITRAESLKLPEAEIVLFTVGFDRAAGQSITDVYAGGLQNALSRLPSNVGRFIYISTTGVYGPAGGEWIDEDTPTDPQREGGKASLAAEQVLASHPIGKRSIILRLAGIYGPGRIPFIDDLRANRPIAAPQSGYLNLIQVDDAADVVVAVSQLPTFDDGPRIYCVSDGHPVERRAFYEEVARQFGTPPPRFTEPDPNSPRALRAAANRRVRNDRMLRDLNVKLSYPDYRAGLRAIVETGNQ